MGLLKSLFTNCAHPKGRMGRAMLKFMNLTHAPLKPGGRFAIMVEVVDNDSKWTDLCDGMTAYSPEQLKKMLDEAGFVKTETHLKKPNNATIIGVNQ